MPCTCIDSDTIDTGINIIVLNVHVPSEEKDDDSKDSFCEELEQVFIVFLSTI